MSEKLIKVSRYRKGEYTVNYDMHGRIMTYKWAGSQPNKIDTKDIPDHVVDWLIMNTTALTSGNLVVEENEDSKEIINNIDNTEDFKNNIHTREEIEKLLMGNINKMKSELNKVTEKSEKQFVVEVAQELKIDSSSKRKFLAEWISVDVAMLFDDSDEE